MPPTPSYDLSKWRGTIPLLQSMTPMNNCSQAPQTLATRQAADAYLDSWNTQGMDWDAWMEEVEHELLRELGLAVMMSDAEGRVSWPRVHASCDYRSALRFEDVVEVEMTVQQLGTSSVHYEFRFRCQGREIADGKVVAVCCRFAPDGTPKSMPIPEWIVEKLNEEKS